jgi:cytochrome b involved in lipid metabolism
MAQVATHAGRSSCWTAIEGQVYDLTQWIGEHPGVQQAILGLCGKDGTAEFDYQHGGQSRPARELASFLLGPLHS